MGQGDRHITFSVVIPVYNGAATICRAVGSVLEQSYAPLEVIVVDDASTDDTIAILSGEYGGRIKLVTMAVNGGSSAARNAGMDAAKGSHIALLDADDSWHKDKLLAARAALQPNPGIALLFHGYTLRPIEQDEIPAQPQVTALPFARLLPGNIISTSCAVLRNDKAFRFEPRMRYTEDYDLWLRISYSHKVSYMPYELTRLFRAVTSEGGISGNTWQMRKGELKAYARLVNLNGLFAFIVPFLWAGSLAKHLLKAAGMFRGRG